ncbi:helix-turn-helix transcriptional regulator [Neptunicoccus cionae]|uniref:helix-turn-helix transcriptional regulator n=1 Tax=Neptunicoccus cionae TaxID=2035344 RepID=UPI000C75FFC3|nr:YafY family protein [Amylibacter cionae]PLS23407.1 transcriptional regulator [Amylibacter cionae]
MARSSRMFEIIQLLRTARAPLTAQHLARALEVTPRTVYRDVASLQAMRVPIEGAAGIGYIMRSGFDLPPLNFDIEEAEAITVGLSMIARTGDKALGRAAARAAAKISQATPLSETLLSSTWGAQAPNGIDLSEIRRAIRDEEKLRIEYLDSDNALSERVILPLSIIYYAEAIVLPAWCELRHDFRHFRADRLQGQPRPCGSFTGRSEALRRQWAAEHKGDL